jgi:hypothetical protein
VEEVGEPEKGGGLSRTKSEEGGGGGEGRRWSRIEKEE